ncbi:hypothetical protein ACFY15_36900 [Streptomyces sp. NPDC001373]|uniref:hypothetical protein n=1 Tax=Streptomyces sp. NPDC001373 TaxID=3364565 RepID=UPI0036A0C260
MTTFTNVRGVKYGEISLVCGPGVATMYNTTSMNNPENPGVPNPNTPDSEPFPTCGPGWSVRLTDG